MVIESPFLCSASVAYQKNGITTIRLTREWEFLERYEATKTMSSFNFAGDRRGAIDHEYKVEAHWIAPGAGTLYWRVNNQATGLSNEGSRIEGTTPLTSGGIVLSTHTNAEGSVHQIEATFYARAGKERFGLSQVSISDGNTGGTTDAIIIGNKWEDTTTEVTSIGIVASTNQIASGSVFNLYRRPHFDKTKLTLWVY